MSNRKASNALEILLKAQPEIAPLATAKAVERIYRIEERVQFDGDRSSAANDIRKVVAAVIAQHDLEGETGDDAA